MEEYRINISADIDAEGHVNTEEVAQDVEVFLNDWVGVETPSGVEVRLTSRD